MPARNRYPRLPIGIPILITVCQGFRIGMSDVLPVPVAAPNCPAAWRDPVAFENGTRPAPWSLRYAEMNLAPVHVYAIIMVLISACQFLSNFSTGAESDGVAYLCSRDCVRPLAWRDRVAFESRRPVHEFQTRRDEGPERISSPVQRLLKHRFLQSVR